MEAEEQLPEEQMMTEQTPSEQMAEKMTPQEPIEADEQQNSDEAEALRERIRELEEQIGAQKRLSERIGRECAEFENYFPEVSLQRVPDEVWGQVREGIPLLAAYALYEKKQQKQRADAERISQRGAHMTAGLLDAAGNEYFSPSQVRAMSQDEVRQNYDRIFESMRHWQ